MLDNYNRYNLLKIFLFHSTESFGLRELARMSEISPPSVMGYLQEFIKQGLVKRFDKNGSPFYQAERDNAIFREYMKMGVIFEINHSGLADYLWKELSPEAIIFYGSFAKGEATEGSDVDLFILGKERKVGLDKFEKKIGLKIHLIFQDDVKKIPKELKNNLINGIVLRGYLKLF